MVVVDSTSPEVAWMSPSNGSYISGIAKLIFDYQDSNVRMAILLVDGRTLANVTGKTAYIWDTTATADGEHILTLMVLDEAGNTNITLPTILNIDNIAPTAGIVTPDEGQIIGGLYNVSFTYYDENLRNATLKIDATVYTVTDATGFILDTMELPDGNYTIILTVIDKAGNINEDAATIIVDNTDPEVNMTNYAELNETELTGIVIIELNASDNNLNNVLLYIDAAAFNVTGLYSYEWNTTEVGDGTHTIRFVAYDKAGNIGETSPLTVKTVNVQEANEENYVAGRDFGLTIGAISGLAIGLIIGFALIVASRKKRKPSET